MPKIKISDIKSGSENVKAVFRRNMPDRTLSWLQKQTFTNAELLEILDLIEQERHKDHRYFHQRLIDSQKGPFSREVFVAYRDILFHVDSLLNLIYNSKGVTDEDKARWMDYSFVTAYYWFLPNFYMNGDCKKVGIDPFKMPFNMSFAANAITYGNKLKRNMEDKEKAYLWSVLDTLSEAEQMEWYKKAVMQTYEKTRIDLLTEYPNTSSEILRAEYGRVNNMYDMKGKVVLHPNCPPELRMEMFELTKDNKYLPQAVQDIFLF